VAVGDEERRRHLRGLEKATAAKRQRADGETREVVTDVWTEKRQVAVDASSVRSPAGLPGDGRSVAAALVATAVNLRERSAAARFAVHGLVKDPGRCLTDSIAATVQEALSRAPPATAATQGPQLLGEAKPVGGSAATSPEPSLAAGGPVDVRMLQYAKARRE
jgi:hypothetical protein